MRTPELAALLDSLSDSALVLDVGGWASADPRADWVIDIGTWETRNYYTRIGGEPLHEPERVIREHWVVHDICAPEPWPFDEDMFDVVICSHTLEDVRDPVKVCAEMERVAKAGYVETPGAAIELTRGIESPLWCGWHHHRWLVEREGDGLVFLGKPHNVHSPLWPAVRSPRRLRPEAAAPLVHIWEGRLPAREDIVVDADELDARLRAIVARSSGPDRTGAIRRRALAGAFRTKSAARKAARRAARRLTR